MTTSKIAPLGGVPTLFVDGKPLPGVAYITYFTDNNRYADFADAGFRLYSLPVFFAAQTINERSKFPPFMPGIYDNGTHFEIFDREIRRILDACPDAMIFPRVSSKYAASSMAAAAAAMASRERSYGLKLNLIVLRS